MAGGGESAGVGGGFGGGAGDVVVRVFFDVVAAGAQSLPVAFGGGTAGGVGVDVVGVPDRRPAPGCAADLITEQDQPGQQAGVAPG